MADGQGTGYEVAVVGGGPAGATAAALLAGAGRRVVVLEKDVFPRFHIGESMLPCNVDLLKRLGVLDQVRASSVDKWGVTLLSGDRSVSREIRFEDGYVPGYPMAFQVLRSRFDEILLRRAEACGAAVHEGQRVLEVQASHRDGCRIVARGPGGAETVFSARFVLDASGQEALIASRRRLRVMSPTLRKAALFAHYAGVPRPSGRDGGNIVLIFLRDGWFWMIPLADSITSVGLVTDGRVLRSGGLSAEELLDEALRRCPAASAVLGSGKRVSSVTSTSDYSYACRGVAGDGYLLVGDAAGFIDPVFSTGIWLAMSSAALAAECLDRAFRSDDGSGKALAPHNFRRYSRTVRRRIRGYMRLVHSFYGPGFVDLFLSPTPSSRSTRAVISLLAGTFAPPLVMRIRLWWFFALVGMQARVPLTPRIPLPGVLERTRP